MWIVAFAAWGGSDVDLASRPGAVTYTAAVEADGPGPAPGGMTAGLADQFVAQLTPAAVEVLALLCHSAPQVTYEGAVAAAVGESGGLRPYVLVVPTPRPSHALRSPASAPI